MSVLESLASLLFPPRCAFCGKPGVRGVLYTAITRARELLVIVGDDSAVNKMAENDRRSRRYSGLKWKMKKGGE